MWISVRIQLNAESRSAAIAAAIVLAVEDETAVHVIFSVVFQLESKAHRGPIRIKEYFVTSFHIEFESGKSVNEFPCEMFFFGKCLDLIKFAVCTIVNHNY